jgi:hypothetical protein
VIEAENLAIAEKSCGAQRSQCQTSNAATQSVKESDRQLPTQINNLHSIRNPTPETGHENVGSRRHPRRSRNRTDLLTGAEVPEIDELSAADLTTAQNIYAQAETVREENLSGSLRYRRDPDGGTGRN